MRIPEILLAGLLVLISLAMPASMAGASAGDPDACCASIGTDGWPGSAARPWAAGMPGAAPAAPAAAGAPATPIVGEPGSGAHDAEDPCCPQGCRDCFRPCCRGSSSADLPGTALDTDTRTVRRTPVSTHDLVGERVNEIFHPPRS